MGASAGIIERHRASVKRISPLIKTHPDWANCFLTLPFLDCSPRIWPPISNDIHEMQLRMLGRSWHSANINRWQWDMVDFQGRSLIMGDIVGLPALLQLR